MSLFKTLTRRSRLEAAQNTIKQARQSEGSKADQLYQKAYQEFLEVISDDLTLSQTLYHWGFALLQQGRGKSGDEAVVCYEDAIEKFAFCQLVAPHFLGAAIDGGVAIMELARLKSVAVEDPLYRGAKKQFEIADQIQKGSSAYNLACIYALMGEGDACLEALQNAQKYGSLPTVQEILNDPDLEKVKHHAWFTDFTQLLQKPVEPVIAAEAAKEEESVVTKEARVVPVGEAIPVNAEVEASSETSVNPEPEHVASQDLPAEAETASEPQEEEVKDIPAQLN